MAVRPEGGWADAGSAQNNSNASRIAAKTGLSKDVLNPIPYLREKVRQIRSPGLAKFYRKTRKPILLLAAAAYQSLLVSSPTGWRSLPAVRPTGRVFEGKGNSVILPSGITRPSMSRPV